MQSPTSNTLFCFQYKRVPKSKAVTAANNIWLLIFFISPCFMASKLYIYLQNIEFNLWTDNYRTLVCEYVLPVSLVTSSHALLAILAASQFRR